MQQIHATDYTIVFNSNGYSYINSTLLALNPSVVFVLVDEHTHQYCLPYFLSNIETEATVEIVEIESGEINKTIDTCISLWNVLTELNADKKSVLINLGGGVITDMGGFVASTFKRGMPFINVPTTLLSMVDASVGGKTGVDLNHLKNQIGLINTPEAVLIDTKFLNTLKPREFNSGVAEMLKHSLISSTTHWDELKKADLANTSHLNDLIYKSVVVKNDIVKSDLYETGIRKYLNFGHTLGHAIETYFLNSNERQNLLHGEAIAIGMVLETYISYKTLNFPKSERDEIKSVFLDLFKPVEFNSLEIDEIISLLKFDKKNSHGNTNFVLLRQIGAPELDCTVDVDLLKEAFSYYSL